MITTSVKSLFIVIFPAGIRTMLSDGTLAPAPTGRKGWDTFYVLYSYMILIFTKVIHIAAS